MKKLITEEDIKNELLIAFRGNQEKYNDYINSETFKTNNRVFYKAMKENRTQQFNLDEQLSLYTRIMWDLSTGLSEEQVFRQLSDNSHLNYFDFFLKQGESEKIVKALHENGLTTEVLKGIKKGISIVSEVDGVRIAQRYEKPDPDSTPVMVEFSIYKDGELIYSFGENNEKQEITKQIPKEWMYTKKGKKRKAPIIRKEIINGETYIYSKSIKTGRTYKQDSLGRFAK